MNKNTVSESEITSPEFWNSRWGDKAAQVIQLGDDQVTDAILCFSDKFLQKYRGGSILEIGGAPGRFLGRFAIDYDLEAHAIDYSPVGCQQLRENFRELERPINVIERNVLEVDAAYDEKFDVVFSLGLIEHFENVGEIIEKHLQYVKDDGVLILGVPNCRGIYHWFWKDLSPDLLSKHVLSTMKRSVWLEWQNQFGIKATNVSYVGGFHPRSLDKRELPGFHWKRLIAKGLRGTLGKINLLKNVNNSVTSGYLIGAFSKNGDK